MPGLRNPGTGPAVPGLEVAAVLQLAAFHREMQRQRTLLSRMTLIPAMNTRHASGWKPCAVHITGSNGGPSIAHPLPAVGANRWCRPFAPAYQRWRSSSKVPTGANRPHQRGTEKSFLSPSCADSWRRPDGMSGTRMPRPDGGQKTETCHSKNGGPFFRRTALAWPAVAPESLHPVARRPGECCKHGLTIRTLRLVVAASGHPAGVNPFTARLALLRPMRRRKYRLRHRQPPAGAVRSRRSRRLRR